MSVYVFNGFIIPHWAPIEIQNLKLDVETKDGRRYNLDLTAIGSYIAVVTTLPQAVGDMGTFKNEVTPVIRSMFDTVGYRLGRAIDVRITSVLDTSNNKLIPFDDYIDELRDAQAERPGALKEVVVLACGSLPLMDALRDLRLAILYPHDTGLMCYRAVESIMQDFRESGDKIDDNKPAWHRLREDLRINRSWIQPLVNASTSNRHGVRVDLTGSERVLLMQHAWKLVDRYVLFLLGGRTALSNVHYEELI